MTTRYLQWCLLVVVSLGLLLVVDSLAFSLSPHSRLVSRHASSLTMSSSSNNENFISNVLFVECGFGNDSHGQSATKAAVRACRNAIEFNSIPSVGKLVPGGYDGLLLQVILGVPDQYQDTLDLQEVEKVFPYGKVEFIIKSGGLVAPSGIAIDALGDKNDDMVIVCAAVTVGY